MYDLRLTEDEFWALTPRKFRALYRRHVEAQREAYAPMAILTSIYVNAHKEKDRPSATPENFMPQLPRTLAQKAADKELQDRIFLQGWIDLRDRQLRDAKAK